MDVQSTRELICKVGQVLFNRNLVGLSGGSISAQAGKYFCITPRHAGDELLWDLQSHQILIFDEQGIKVDGAGEFPEEFKVHFQLYRNIPSGNAVIYSLAPNVMAFCTAGISLPPVVESACLFGKIGFSDDLPLDSQELAQSVISKMGRKEEMLASLGVPVMLPSRGLIVLGRTLLSACEAVERIEVNARALLMSSLLTGLYDPERKFRRQDSLK